MVNDHHTNDEVEPNVAAIHRSQFNLVRVMRAEMEITHRRADHHLPFKSAEDFDDGRGYVKEPTGIDVIRRLLQFVPLSPGRTRGQSIKQRGVGATMPSLVI